jgi:hypothetical protein
MTEHDTDAVVGRGGMRELLRRICNETGVRRVTIDDILSALKPGDRLPGGAKVAPDEPTEAMKAAGAQAWNETDDFQVDVVAAIYRAMLKALGGKS